MPKGTGSRRGGGEKTATCVQEGKKSVRMRCGNGENELFKTQTRSLPNSVKRVPTGTGCFMDGWTTMMTFDYDADDDDGDDDDDDNDDDDDDGFDNGYDLDDDDC